MNITVGADPEFFVRKGTSFISGHTFACGTKEHPMATENGSIQVDGLALECNVRPSKTKEEFIRNVYAAFGDLSKFVKSVDTTCELVPAASVFFGAKYLSELPHDVRKLGCTPDYNAYTEKVNPAPNERLSFRTGSGHIHIGWTENENPRSVSHFKKCCTVVRQLDYFLGLPSLLWDNDRVRRRLYGQAGAFRAKPYGVEYRVLSNTWLENPEIAGFIFDKVHHAMALVDKGEFLEKKYGDIAQRWINGSVFDWPKKGNLGPILAQEILHG